MGKQSGGTGGQPLRPASGKSPIRCLKDLLDGPVSGASLAMLRICFGVVMALECWSLCRPSEMTGGRIPIENYYLSPDIHFNFPYHGFEWLPTLPAPWFYAVVILLAVSGLMMAAGVFYRLSAALVFLSFGYFFTVESTKTYWQSYYYIELLVAFLLMWMPAARRYSIDAWLRRKRGLPPAGTIPFWPIFLLRGQLLIMYFYAGVAKLNADWLLDAAPLRWALRERHVGQTFAPLLSAAQLETVKGFLHDLRFAYFLSYAGLAFDLSIGFLLLIRRTRILGIILMAMFHAMNHFVVYDNIDWFPLVGFATALVFLDPDWPERFWQWVRRPRLNKPDWVWAAGGAVLAPVVGAALGWKLPRSPAPAGGPNHFRVAQGTMVFVAGWLIWQGWMPLRHYFIPGDARITYEGLSFSWRLKTDEHRAITAQFYVRDSNVISETNGTRSVNWAEWHGDKVLYRVVSPGRIDWRQLPEIVVLLEPVTGERVVYNPYSGVNRGRSEAESRERVRTIWEQLYGHQPASATPALPLSQVLESIAATLHGSGDQTNASQIDQFALLASDGSATRGGTARDRERMVGLLRNLCSRDSTGALVGQLRQLTPFGLDGEPPTRAPFLVIDETNLFSRTAGGLIKLNAKAWKDGLPTRSPIAATRAGSGTEPLIIYMGDIATDSREMLPQAALLDFLDNPGGSPRILWNTLRDVNMSKLSHISIQPFYLRRYARRIAELWQKEYGRRPVVNAITAVSLNHRPYQKLVDADTDLASVPVVWFGHNSWIRDLDTARIPRETLAQQAPRK